MATPPAAVGAALEGLLTAPEADSLMGADIQAQALAIERGLYPDWRQPAS
jgi:hypothetical protein